MQMARVELMTLAGTRTPLPKSKKAQKVSFALSISSSISLNGKKFRPLSMM